MSRDVDSIVTRLPLPPPLRTPPPVVLLPSVPEPDVDLADTLDRAGAYVDLWNQDTLDLQRELEPDWATGSLVDLEPVVLPRRSRTIGKLALAFVGGLAIACAVALARPIAIEEGVAAAPERAPQARPRAPEAVVEPIAPARVTPVVTRTARIERRRAPRAAAAEPATGFLTIDASPYATIYVDGNEAGDTPLVRFPVAAGKHRVRALFADGSVRRVAIAVPPGETVRHRIAGAE